MERLAELGITSGCATGPARYCPADSVTRGQMATFVARALGLVPLPRPITGGAPAPFVDVATAFVHSCGLRPTGWSIAGA